MKNQIYKTPAFILMAMVVLLMLSSNVSAKKKKVLIFCKTTGFHHASISAGIKAIQKLGQENKFQVDSTIDDSKFTEKNLKQYAAVIFLSTTHDVLNEQEQHAFEQYIKSGGGYVGIHAATDTEYDWPWYGNLVGAWFKSHPGPKNVLPGTLHVVDHKFPGMEDLPETWNRKDEWYNFKWITKEPLHILITIDEKTYNPGPGAMGDNHPMSWYHEFDGGRSFYTALGHTAESFSDPLYLKHLLGGIQYAMGKKID